MVLHKSYRIYHKTDKTGVYSLLIEDRNDRNEALLFESGAVATLASHETDSLKTLYTTLLDAYGFLGVLNISFGDQQQQQQSSGANNSLLLIAITGCVSVGKIQNSEIFSITETTFISLANNPVDVERLSDVRKILSSGNFYFAYPIDAKKGRNFDLTLSAQKAQNNSNCATDNRFFWNQLFYLHFKFFDINTERWLVRAMCGSVSISTVYVGSQQAKACLISRLSNERAGTRFNVRGVNDNGNVANFVETEQVIFLDDRVASYVLVRGSIPLFWEQTGVQVGAHRVKVSREFELSQPAFDRHFALLLYLYGPQMIVNLVSSGQSGEASIGRRFRDHYQASIFSDQHAGYVAFDYHQQCSRGKEDNLRKLREDLKACYKQFAFFYALNDEIKQKQNGTFRVNCIDCLDRTNRVQTFIGLEILLRQLKALQFDEKSTIVSRFQEVYKNMWQVNGDQVSRIYAGTGALEGKSKLRDGTLSVARTIQNNLLDSGKQEAFDVLLTGKTLATETLDKIKTMLPTNYHCLPLNILMRTSERYLEFAQPSRIKVSVGTWNVNGGKHFSDIVYKRCEPLTDWLLDANKKTSPSVTNLLDLSLDASLTDLDPESPDLFAIGFEEIVDLSAQNIMATSTTAQKEWLIQLEKALSRNEMYVCATSVQLVGVCLFLFTKPKHVRFIRDVSTDIVKTGLGGATGNKGGVGIRLRFYNSSLCFVCSHFAAGQSGVADRNSDFNDIARKMFTSIGKPLGTHDYVFWCGDFNYRIDMSNEAVKQLVVQSDWSALLERDQLRCQQNEDRVFHKYREGEINFAPTYKYDIGCDEYDTSEKARIPAWTDRVLFRKYYATKPQERAMATLDYGEIIFYGRAELTISDHRPVLAQFAIDILRVSSERRAEVFRDTLRRLGPLDATIVVREEAGVGRALQVFGDEATEASQQQSHPIEPVYVQEIVNKLSQEVGEVVLARFGDDHLRLTFREGTLALKAAAIEHITVHDKVFGVSLKATHWVSDIETEIENWTRAVPLVEGSELVDIDELVDYDVKIKTRASSPEAILEPETITTSGPPGRPAPPATADMIGNESSSRPMRPAPPRPPGSTRAASSNSSLHSNGTLDSGIIAGDESPLNLTTDSNNSFVMSPPKMPPPALPSVPPPPASFAINHDDHQDDSGAEEEEEEEGEDGETSFDSQPPSLPPPSMPPPPQATNIPQRPPPIPVRRPLPPPNIPPRE